jgi:hypothetical protein
MGRVIGVRCRGEREVTFALIEAEAVDVGERVMVFDDDRTRSGVVVIAPEQLLEFRAPEPRARAEVDSTSAEAPSGEGAELFKSLNLECGE